VGGGLAFRVTAPSRILRRVFIISGANRGLLAGAAFFSGAGARAFRGGALAEGRFVGGAAVIGFPEIGSRATLILVNARLSERLVVRVVVNRLVCFDR